MEKKLISLFTGTIFFSSLLVFNSCSKNQTVYRPSEQKPTNYLIIYPSPTSLEDVMKKHPENWIYYPIKKHKTEKDSL